MLLTPPFHTAKPTTVSKPASPSTPPPWPGPTRNGLLSKLVSMVKLPTTNGETMDQRPPGDKLQTHNHQRLPSLRRMLLVTPPTLVTMASPLELKSTPSPWEKLKREKTSELRRSRLKSKPMPLRTDLPNLMIHTA